MSGYDLGIIDPDENLFSTQKQRETGIWLNFQHDSRTTLSHHNDNGNIFSDVFKMEPRSGHCRGTVFRFRLRSTPSRLSQTIYSHDRITELFKEFEKQGHLNLIFLKNLAKIEFYVREKGERDATKWWSFTAQKESGKIDRTEEKKFMMTIQQAYEENKPQEYSFINTVKIVFTGKGFPMRNETHYAIVNYYAGDLLEEEDDLITEDDAREFGFIPLVGIAFPISSEKSSYGHVFCTLPLPIFQAKATGLPVHVNGFFALSADRKDLKWPTAGRASRNDTEVSWNMFLIEKVLPRAYEKLFLHLRDDGNLFRKEVMKYNVLPDVTLPDSRWQKLVKNTFSRLFEHECVYSRGKGGWILIEDAFFQDKERADYESASDFLIRCKVPVVDVPQHIDDAMAELEWPFEKFNPRIVREQVSKESKLTSNLASYDKQRLLNYMLQDAKDILSLCGCQILPLEDGTFASPSRRGTTLFVTSNDHPKELVPGCEGRLISTRINFDLREKMIGIAESGKYAVPA